MAKKTSRRSASRGGTRSMFKDGMSGRRGYSREMEELISGEDYDYEMRFGRSGLERGNL